MPELSPHLPGLSLETSIHESAQVAVYRGHTSDNATPVVVKILQNWDPSSPRADAVERAFAISVAIQLKPIVRGLRMFDSGYQRVVVMEDSGAIPLRDVLEGEQQSTDTVLRLAIRISEALGQLHRNRIYHGLPSPDHLLLDSQSKQIQLIGFDYGHMPGLEWESGTPKVASRDTPYAAPELLGQIQQEVDHRADLYTVGVTLYEAFVGSHPFADLDLLEAAHALVAVRPGSLAERRPDVSPVLCAIVDKLLAAHPPDRYQSAFGLKVDLQRCLDQLTSNGSCASFPLGIHDVVANLTTPEKLYGRAEELALLQRNFAGCLAGRISLVTIAGPPGIGKTRLVEASRVASERQGALFVAGKVEQFAGGTPFAPLGDALSELIQHLLAGDEASFRSQRAELVEAVGIHMPVLVNLLPELALVVGEQSQQLHVTADQAQNQLRLALPSLIRTLARPERPLVIFLDDLQWADATTMTAIELLLTDPQMVAVQLIVSYRDAEVDEDHPLAQLLARLTEGGLSFDQLTLQSISQEGLGEWLADGLRSSPEAVAPLAELLMARVGGNPFVVGQLLYTLQHQGLLYLDQATDSWRWHAQAIEDLEYADDIATLLAGRMGGLPDNVQKALAAAACAGRRFDAELVAAACSMAPAELTLCLQEAEREGLVSLDSGRRIAGRGIAAGAGRYVFQHDRLQEVAKAGLSEEREREVHWQLGQFLLRQAESDESAHTVFTILEQLNLARELVETEQQRQELVHLNFLAGDAAKQSTAFQEAIQYLAIAIELMSDAGWTAHYAERFQAQYQMADCEYILGNFSVAESLLKEAAERATTALDRARVSSALVNAFGNQADFERAVDNGLQGLAHLGWVVPEDEEERQAATREATETIQGLLDTMAYQADSAQPMATDPELLLRMDIVLRVTPVAFVGGQGDLFRLLAAAGARLALTEGCSEHSASALANYTPLLVGPLQDYRQAYKVGLMGLSLCQSFPDSPSNGPALHNIATFALHWGQSARDVHGLSTEALSACLRAGDFTSAGYRVVTDAYASILSGGDLDGIDKDIDDYLELFDKIKAEMIWETLVTAKAALGTLTGRTSDFDEDARRSTTEIEDGLEEKNPHLLSYHAMIHLMVNCVLGDFRGTAQVAARAEPHIDVIGGIYIWTCYYFFRPLALAQLLPEMDPAEKNVSLATIARDQQRLDDWAEICPLNYKHLADLLRASVLAAEGRSLDALRCFDLCIAEAREGGFVIHEALGNELAGKVCLELELRRAAASYLSLAHRHYLSWGASVKAQQLTSRYAELLAANPTTTAASSPQTFSSYSGELEHQSVLKAAQAISRETDPQALIEALMQTVLQCSGATRAVLLHRAQGEWAIRADHGDRGDGVSRRERAQSAGESLAKHVPMGVVRYVQRTDQQLVVGGAQMNFIIDSAYRGQFAPRSVMCLPIPGVEGETKQLIYLENNRVENVFSQERREALSVILAQASISLSNAELYDSLKREVIEKSKAKRELERMLSEKEILLREVHHRVRNNLQVTKSMLSLHAQRDGTDDSQKAFRRASERVNALSAVHDLLYANPNLVDIDLVGFVQQLCSRLKGSFGGTKRHIELIVEGAPGQRVNANATVPCGIIINEAISNAMEHAFPSNSGRILVSVKSEDGMTSLEIQDDGVGLPEGWDWRESGSLGMQLLDGLARQLRGEIDIRGDAGTMVSVHFPEYTRTERVAEAGTESESLLGGELPPADLRELLGPS